MGDSKLLGTPWEAFEFSEEYDNEYGKQGYVMSVSGMPMSKAISFERARLMAAAPELAEALEEVLHLENVVVHPYGDAKTPFDNARKALKKAGR